MTEGFNNRKIRYNPQFYGDHESCVVTTCNCITDVLVLETPWRLFTYMSDHVLLMLNIFKVCMSFKTNLGGIPLFDNTYDIIAITLDYLVYIM